MRKTPQHLGKADRDGDQGQRARVLAGDHPPFRAARFGDEGEQHEQVVDVGGGEGADSEGDEAEHAGGLVN